MQRDIHRHLLAWRDGPRRKSLLVRGARQVGKTYSIREFGKGFDHFVEVNFEEHPRIKAFFEDALTPQKIVEQLSLYFGVRIIPGSTLLFFDEIQACPEAIHSLRFFYEKMPDLHLIAAGSLLEFALAEIPSLGVGRLDSLFMYPLTFLEYLEALDHSRWVSALQEANFSKGLHEVIHQKILEQLKVYLLIGGLPEVVKAYADGHDLLTCQKILDGLLLTYFDDFVKYKKNAPVDRLTEVFRAIAYQAGGKFKYSNISSERSSTYKTALDLLVKAGLAYQIFHSSASGLPLGAQVNPGQFKVAMFDVGILQRVLGLNLSEYVLADFKAIINKGALAEIFVGTELTASDHVHQRPELYYWHREARSSNAEIDYVISANSAVIPIEVKSGAKGTMKSLHIFLKEKGLKKGLKLSELNFTIQEDIISVPIYAAGLVRKLCSNLS